MIFVLFFALVKVMILSKKEEEEEETFIRMPALSIDERCLEILLALRCMC